MARLKRLALLSILMAMPFVSRHAHACQWQVNFLDNLGAPGFTVTQMLVPGGVQAHASYENPIIGTPADNVYAPDLVTFDGPAGAVWLGYYGGWVGSSTHDKIYLSISDDLNPEGPWTLPSLIIDNGSYNHVNDPSVQSNGRGVWFMAYTEAKTDTNDWIGISASTDLLNWNPNAAGDPQRILLPRGFTFAGRPSLLWTGTEWRLFFDGKNALIDQGATHSYMATCTTAVPHDFSQVPIVLYPDLGLCPGSSTVNHALMEPDVELENGLTTVVANDCFHKIVKMTSTNFGTTWSPRQDVISTADPTVKRQFIDNPAQMWNRSVARYEGVAYGQTNDNNLTHHQIGFAYSQYLMSVRSGATWHIFTYGRYRDYAIQETFGFSSFDEVRVSDQSGNVMLDQSISAVSGAQYALSCQ